ncbi:hypothetical protein LOK49_Contig55G00012 [Camellia lanceoleosa]|nr:hypothetical protein LOK49_Contig55G00012 [Camellia lanceoleosa]
MTLSPLLAWARPGNPPLFFFPLARAHSDPHNLSLALALPSQIVCSSSDFDFDFVTGSPSDIQVERGCTYALYCRAHSLANVALKKFKSLTTADQVMIKELKMLYDDSRSNSCIEHATGIIEEEKAPENLSKKISRISLTRADKKVPFRLGFSTCLS